MGRIGLPRRRASVLLAAAVVLAAGVGSALWGREGQAAEEPAYAMTPTGVPAYAAVPGSAQTPTCRSSDGLSDPPGSARTWLDQRPQGGKVLWLPGLNARPCRAELTTLSAAQARRIASAVDAAPAFPPGPRSCPSDDGSGLVVYLSYAGRTRAEVVVISLSGCTALRAPGRDTREVTEAVRSSLTPFPALWNRTRDARTPRR